jgi:transposase
MSGLTTQQLEAVAEVARGVSLPEIAKKLKISTRTLQRWAKLPEFIAARNDIQNKVSRQVKADVVDELASISSRLENLASKSLDCLGEIIDNREARTSDRIQAAKLVLTEWQRTQTPAMHELAAVEILVKSGFFSHEHLVRLKEAVERLTLESQAIFRHPSAATSSLNSEALN